jgi:hypothetical protein
MVMLDRFRGGDSNMRSVWLCSRNDAIGNVAVIAAALGVFASAARWPDLIVAAVIAALNLSAALYVARLARAELRTVASPHHASSVNPVPARNDRLQYTEPNMRTILLPIAMIALLLMSVDGGVDMAQEGHPHGDNQAHQIDATADVSPGADDHCEHCCHGHAPGIAPHLAAIATALAILDRHSRYTSRVLSHAQAPPKPPPIA